jgi:hypothetical protein
MHTLSTLFRNYLIKVDNVIRNHDVITHTQTIMGNGVIIVSRHNHAHLSHLYYKKKDIYENDFLLASNVTITTITNAIKIHRSTLELLHACRRTSLETIFKADCVNKDDDVITHAQRIMSNGVLIV